MPWLDRKLETGAGGMLRHVGALRKAGISRYSSGRVPTAVLGTKRRATPRLRADTSKFSRGPTRTAVLGIRKRVGGPGAEAIWAF